MPGSTVKDMIIKVYLTANQEAAVDLPITPETLCKDVIDLCKEPVEEHCHLAEVFHDNERPIGNQEIILDILEQFGPQRHLVKFFLRHEDAGGVEADQGQKSRSRPSSRGSSVPEDLMMATGVDLSIKDLRDVASRQQQQIGNQQQLLVAKQQRLKFLKQQELKHQQQQAAENERLRKLKEKMDAQEQKLQKLRAVQGQVESTKIANTSLSAELDSVKTLFAEKERELARCISKVDEMTKQLEQLSRGHLNGGTRVPSEPDLDRLKRELLQQNQQNEQQSRMLESKARTANQRSEQLSTVDRRIEELKDMLRQRKSSRFPSNGQYDGNRNNNAQIRVPNGSVSKGRSLNDRSMPPNDWREPARYGGVNYNRNNDSSLVNGEASDPRFRKPLPPPRPTDLQPRPRGNNSPRGSPVTDHRPVPPPRRSSQDILGSNHKNKDDNSGSDTSSLTENSSIDSIPSFSGMRPRSQNSRPSVGSPVGAGRGLEERTRSPIPRGNASSPNQVGRVQISSNDPRARYLQSRPAGDRSPMYSPSSPTAGTPWPQPAWIAGSRDNLTSPDGDGRHQRPDVNSPVSDNDNKPKSLHGAKPFPQAAGLHPPSPPTRRQPPPAKIPGNGQPFQDSGDHQTYDVLNSNQAIHHERSPAIVGGVDDPVAQDKQTKDPYESDVSQKEEYDDSPISPRRPASPVHDPTLTLHHRYKDIERLHKMPRPLKKRISFTESKDENYSFMRQDYRDTLFHPVNDSAAGDLKEEAEKKKEAEDNEEYSKDAILTHQQYRNALLQLAQTPLLSTQRTEPHSILKKERGVKRKERRVRFDPLALLLDAALEGEYEQVRRIIQEVPNPSDANDEGITALHNAICANHHKIVNFLIVYGVDVNSPDSDGWTPLHCAASCNNVNMVRSLVEHGACIFASTISDTETPLQKCESEEEGYLGCSEYLKDIEDKMGKANNGEVLAAYPYKAENEDELTFQESDKLKITRKGDDDEEDWWWASLGDKEGYVPRNLLAMYPKVKNIFS